MAVITNEHKSKLESDSSTGLRAEEVAQWIQKIPPGARIVAIQKDIGSQRDPIVVTVGLKAEWGGD